MQPPFSNKPGYFLVRTQCPQTMYLVRGRLDLWLARRGIRRDAGGSWRRGAESYRFEQLADGIGQLIQFLVRRPITRRCRTQALALVA